jgi:protein TonB
MKMKQLILIPLLLCAFIVKGQRAATAKKDTMDIYTYVEKPPKFPGGEEALAKFLSKNVRVPAEITEMGFVPTRFLSFVIDARGNVIDKSIHNVKESDYTLYDKVLLDILDKMPKWIPAEHNHKKVAVRFQLPIRICLQE